MDFSSSFDFTPPGLFLLDLLRIVSLLQLPPEYAQRDSGQLHADAAFSAVRHGSVRENYGSVDDLAPSLSHRRQSHCRDNDALSLNLSFWRTSAEEGGSIVILVPNCFWPSLAWNHKSSGDGGIVDLH